MSSWVLIMHPDALTFPLAALRAPVTLDSLPGAVLQNLLVPRILDLADTHGNVDELERRARQLMYARLFLPVSTPL